ncbi:MAG: pilus assembly protein [Magnetospirillum sp.]|nr:pilus assembly protein [Magnetospirillum sp.]
MKQPSLLHRVLHCQQGSIAYIFALSMLPMIASVGLAVDAARAYAVKSKLSFALDAAGLAVGSSNGTPAQLQDIGQKFFNANFQNTGLDATASFSITVNGDKISANGSAKVSTTFMKLAGIDQITVTETSEVTRAIRGLELAMILDNTGSMTTSDNIGALRDAAQELVDILFGGYTVHPKLAIGLVPYSAAVNPGTVAQGLIDTSEVVDTANLLGWKGCVVERAGHAIEDSTASVKQWKRYKWDPAVDNYYDATKSSTVKADWSNGNASTGPNVGCPTPITPLTHDKATVDTAVQAMRAWSRGGTMGDIGMAWGLRLLSPEAPFTEGLPWGTAKWSKAAILMTDGENQFYKLTSTTGANKVNNAVVSDYTGYGRLDQYAAVGTTNTTTAKNTINTRLSQVCQAMKDKGITVYTITFTSGINQATKDIYKNCASSATKYFDSPSQTELKNSFHSIAIELSQLRVSQ